MVYNAWQFIEQDEFDSRTNEFIEEVIEKFNLRNNSSAEIKMRSINSAYSNVETDDKVIEILLEKQI